MTSLLNALNAGKTSLLTNQKAIEIVGNNIANVNTEGYSRQNADLNPVPAVNFNDFFIGQGVTVSSVSRDYNLFITRQLQAKTIDYGAEAGRSDALTELERIFNVTENNLAGSIDRFFDAWQGLSTNPGGAVERDIVLQRGEQLGDAFRTITGELDRVAQNLNQEISAGVASLNEQLATLADLNQRINLVEISGQTANSARDQRDLLARELSETLGVQTYTDNRGMLAVQLPGGIPLVQGDRAMTITTVTTGTEVNLQVQVGGRALDVTQANLGGRFQGMFAMRDSFIDGLRTDLDTLAADLAGAVNSEHAKGYAPDGTTGANFFADLSGYTTNQARHLQVALTGGAEIAAAGQPNAAPGDNENALRIAALEVAHTVGTSSDSFDEFFSQLVATVGIEAARNDLALTGAKDATVQLQNLRDGFSGVSLEEEMIDLIQYQRGFESSAKFLSTVDEMMTAILQLRG